MLVNQMQRDLASPNMLEAAAALTALCKLGKNEARETRGQSTFLAEEGEASFVFLGCAYGLVDIVVRVWKYFCRLLFAVVGGFRLFVYSGNSQVSVPLSGVGVVVRLSYAGCVTIYGAPLLPPWPSYRSSGGVPWKSGKPPRSPISVTLKSVPVLILPLLSTSVCHLSSVRSKRGGVLLLCSCSQRRWT